MESLSAIADRLAQSLQRQESNIRNHESSVPHKCGKCGDEGRIVVAGFAQECECLLEKRVTLQLPRKYRAASLLDFSQPVQNAIFEWFENPRDGLFIVGSVGTGKTYLAAAIVRTLLLIRQEAYFRRCAQLYSELRESYRQNESELSVFRNYVIQRYVVLDDLGAGSLSDHERRAMLEILDQRTNKSLPTIITSNWSLDQISARIDDRIASRLASFESLLMEGPDRRIPT